MTRTLAQETARAIQGQIDGDLAAMVLDAMPGITASEAMERADALSTEYPPKVLIYMLEARRIRLAVRSMQP